MQRRRFDSLNQKLVSERAKRKHMEKTLAHLMKVSKKVEIKLESATRFERKRPSEISRALPSGGVTTGRKLASARQLSVGSKRSLGRPTVVSNRN